MLKKIMLISFLALLVFPAAAMAEFKAGDKEFTLSGSGSSDNDVDSGGFAVQGSFGYFLSDMMEGIIRQEVRYSDSDPGPTAWDGSTGVGLQFNFSLMNVTPFLGGTVGYVYGDSLEDTWFAAPEGGIKAFVNNTTFVQALVQYQWFFDDSSDADENFDDGRFVYGLGLGVKF